MLPGAAGQTSSKKKDKKRSKYVALDFSAHFLFFIFYFVSSFLLILREGEKNPKKKIQKKKDKKRSKYVALDFSAHFLFFIF
jgi:hypothetical protein